MDTIDWAGIALVITALGGTGKIIINALRQIEKKVDVAAVKIQEIDRAVNGKAPGDQSMVSQVADIHQAVTVEDTG